MGRSGYNGGDPGGRRRPKTDNVHIFATTAALDHSVLQKSRIVQSGEGLRNEDGGIQEEFGYILRLEESEEGLKVEEKQKLHKLKSLDLDSSLRTTQSGARRHGTCSKVPPRTSGRSSTVGVQAAESHELDPAGFRHNVLTFARPRRIPR
jgi:hypothetical protein